jgi:hypothetical protein
MLFLIVLEENSYLNFAKMIPEQQSVQFKVLVNVKLKQDEKSSYQLNKKAFPRGKLYSHKGKLFN